MSSILPKESETAPTPTSKGSYIKGTCKGSSSNRAWGYTCNMHTACQYGIVNVQ